MPGIGDRYFVRRAVMFGAIMWSTICGTALAEPFSVETFATVGDVRRYLGTEAGRQEVLQILRRMGITKIYVDLLRSGRLTDWDVAKDCHRFFTGHDIRVSGGITTSAGPGWGLLAPSGRCYCYTSEKTQEDLKTLFAKAARLFDEIIVDDFLMTFCDCDLCDRARAGRTWEEYRSALMAHVSRSRIVRPAHAVNPRCRVIIKYPQWYDKFHEFGYNPQTQGEIFDAVWVGTETRNPETRRFGFVQQYEGYFNFSWIAGYHPEKTSGAWYDHLDITPEVFVEQGYQSVLAGAKHLTLFHLGDLMSYGDLQEAFLESMPKLRLLAGLRASREPHGLFAYKPLAGRGDAGEFYIFDYLGMLGIPVVPCHTFPDEISSVFLSTHALKDPDLIDKMEDYFQAGGSIIATPALLEALSEESLVRRRFGYGSPVVSRARCEGMEISVEEETVGLATPVEVAYVLHPSHGTNVPVRLVHDGKTVPLFTERATKEGGQAMVLNLSTFSQPDFDAIGERFLAPKPVSFLGLPRGALDRIRQAMTHRRPVLRSAPAKVSCYLLGDNVVVVENFRDEPVTVSLRLAGNWTELTRGLTLVSRQDDEREVTIPARDIIALRASG